MKRITLLTSILMFILLRVTAQMGINKDGTTPHPSAMLDIKASANTNAKGLLMPRVTDHTVITSPATGLMVFNTTTNTFWYYNGLVWTDMGNGGSSGAWLQNGTNVYTNNNNVGINTATPLTTLDVKGNGFIVSQKIKLIAGDPNSFVRNMPLSDTQYVSSTGTLYDPSGPNAPYPSGSINTNFYIIAEFCNRWSSCSIIGLKLTFETFDTEANGDSVIITDGTNVLAKYSGNVIPPDFYFNGKIMGIRFKTNGNSIVGQGFKIKWQSIEKDGSSTPLSSIIGNAAFFDVGKGAIRSGNSTLITPEIVGDYSTGMGYEIKAKGFASTALGSNTSASSSASVAMGYRSNASGDFSTAMNYYTNASTTSSFASGDHTISGGYTSTAMGFYSNASGYASTALGNRTNASGYNSTTMGTGTIASGFATTAMGYNTIAGGDNATAMGSNAYAYNDGSFVIGDSPNSSSTVYSQNTNSFTSRFRSGYYLYTSANMVSGAILYGGNNSWSTVSDSTKKENFQAIDGENILKKIAKMRTVTWNYKGQDPKTFRHYGLMAQEFFNAFGRDKLGTIGNDTTIASADFDGVSITAIKALEKRTQDLQIENELLKNRLKDLEKSNSEMVSLKDEMEQLKLFLLPNKEKITTKSNAEK